MLLDNPLIDIHINTLFDLDAQGRLRCVNELGEPPAPLFYMARTRQGNRWHFRDDLSVEVVAELEHICRAEPIATDLGSAPQTYHAIHAALRDHLSGQTPDEYIGPAYWIPAHVEPPTNSEVALISPANIDLCRTTFPWLQPWIEHPDLGPVAATMVQGQAVALCFCSRRPRHATEAGVETLAEYRGHGYATAAVIAWATAVRNMGILPLYSTSWDNLASQAIARKLRMIRYGVDWSMR